MLGKRKKKARKRCFFIVMLPVPAANWTGYFDIYSSGFPSGSHLSCPSRNIAAEWVLFELDPERILVSFCQI